LGPTFWVTVPSGYKPSAGDIVGDAVYWNTLAPRVAEHGCNSVLRDGPSWPDKASKWRFHRRRESAHRLTRDSTKSDKLPAWKHPLGFEYKEMQHMFAIASADDIKIVAGSDQVNPSRADPVQQPPEGRDQCRIIESQFELPQPA
jgi:hypothetical protein